MITVLVPLVVINVIWLHSSQTALKQAAANRQSILLSTSAQRVNEALNAKISNVVGHSQDQNVIDINIDQAKLALMQYANQDSDIQRIALVDSAGNEKIVIQGGAFNNTLTNVKSSNAFSVVTQISNQAYISGVSYNAKKQPIITISVPLLSLSHLGDQNLSDAEALARRFGSDVKGALIVEINLNSLWQSLLSAKLGNDGYVYLVNQTGAPIAYPNEAFIGSHPSLATTTEVNNAVKLLQAPDLQTKATSYKPNPSITTSETGVQVLSSYYPISLTQWAIIGEEPIASVYGAANKVAVIAVMIFLISIPTIVGLVFLATRSIIKPIHELTKGAVRIGSGDFSHPLEVKGKDELSVLARTFNQMGHDLQGLIDRYRKQNIDLLSERTKLQVVLNTIADGVIALDREFKIVLVNKPVATLIAQTDPTVLYGQRWLDVFNLSYKSQAFHNQLLTSESPHFSELQLSLQAAEKYIDLTAIHLASAPNGIVYILTVHDITESRELENMKLDFVSMAAHELRTPLTAVHGYLELVATDPSNSAGTKQYIQRALAVADRLGSLINNLLSLSRIERRTLKLNMVNLDWAAIITSEVKNQSFSAQAKHINIYCQLPEQPISVVGDELALREVLGNLLSNAVHYTDNNGQITVSVAIVKEGIKTMVTDTGIGIPEESLGKLFTKYYRAKGGLTTNSQGTGIGLFISKSIVESHGGSIGATSSYGKGSTFYFTLPLPDPGKITSPPNTAAEIKPEARSKVEWFE